MVGTDPSLQNLYIGSKDRLDPPECRVYSKFEILAPLYKEKSADNFGRTFEKGPLEWSWRFGILAW